MLTYAWCVGAELGDDAQVLGFVGFVIDIKGKTLDNLYTVVFPTDCTFAMNIAFKTQRNPKTHEEYPLLVDSGAVAAVLNGALRC